MSEEEVSRNIEGLKLYKEKPLTREERLASGDPKFVAWAKWEESRMGVVSQRKSKQLQAKHNALQALNNHWKEKFQPSFKAAQKKARRLAQLRAFIHVKQIEIKALNAVMRQFRNSLVMKQASLSLLEEQFHSLQREEKV